MSVSIALHNLGKKFGKEWIFRKLDLGIAAGDKLVILGGNGSGKSTLLQVISGYVTANEGQLSYTENGSPVQTEQIKDKIAFASPYLQLIEELTLLEMVEHASQFKPLRKEIDQKRFVEIIQLETAANKFIKQFSSGMKQRLKLGLAILSDTPVLLLDEPVSNLDKQAIAWYRDLVTTYGKDRTVIVCSNAIEDEYFFCTKSLKVEDYKQVRKS